MEADLNLQSMKGGDIFARPMRKHATHCRPLFEATNQNQSNGSIEISHLTKSRHSSSRLHFLVLVYEFHDESLLNIRHFAESAAHPDADFLSFQAFPDGKAVAKFQSGASS